MIGFSGVFDSISVSAVELTNGLSIRVETICTEPSPTIIDFEGAAISFVLDQLVSPLFEPPLRLLSIEDSPIAKSLSTDLRGGETLGVATALFELETHVLDDQ